MRKWITKVSINVYLDTSIRRNNKKTTRKSERMRKKACSFSTKEHHHINTSTCVSVYVYTYVADEKLQAFPVKSAFVRILREWA